MDRIRPQLQSWSSTLNELLDWRAIKGGRYNKRKPGTAEGSLMEAIRICETTDKDGALHLRIPLGKPDTEFDVIVVVQPKAPGPTDTQGWPPGYFDLAGSITDETFVRPTQGELPRPVDLE